MKIEVRTPARLHLGLLDTNGSLGRMYGSIGVAIERPNVVLEAEPAGDLTVEGLEAQRTAVYARQFLDHFRLPHKACLKVKSTIPAHIGLGSGTQLALAVGSALARLGKRDLSVNEIAAGVGRGLHSGIGTGAFERGGFVLDGGHRTPRLGEPAEAAGSLPSGCPRSGVPPVLFQHPVPADWYFVIAVPAERDGISGAKEMSAFRTMPQAPAELAEKISRLILMKLLPALVEDDITSFGEALTEVQRKVGDCFASVQGGRYANPVSGKLIDYLLARGAAGAGQSSWGPAVYGLVRGEAAAFALENDLRAFLEGCAVRYIDCVRADNQGARIRILAGSR